MVCVQDTLVKALAKGTPVQLLVIGYVVIILLGSLLLRLPVAASRGSPQQYIDALFTATSAVSTTGLIVVDTGSFYSLFGQIVILLLFQIGGLGYMAFVVLMVYTLGGKPSLTSAVTLQESLSGITLGNMKKYLKSVFLFTVIFEASGALILALFWVRNYPVSRAVYLGVFHSVSAFCTSGFSVFSDSFMSYQSSGFIALIISTLSLAGGIGFIVLYDIRGFISKRISHERPCQLSLHSKLSLLISTMLIVTGIVILFVSENDFSLPQKVLTSVFQSVSASSTTGFNTVDIGALSTTSLFAIIILMFIGTSPGGSGGGIKVTAFGSMVSSIWAILKGREDVNIFSRRIPSETVRRSFVIGLMVLLWVVTVTLILTTTEDTDFLTVLFEVVSAAGTVGLSTGITSGLSLAGKVLIIITMLIGRVGPLAIAFTLMGEPRPLMVKYAEGEVFIG